MMDAPGLDPALLRRTLIDLAWINRTLGGSRVVLKELAPLLGRLPSPVRILDVGTGYADIPRAIARWARRRGIGVEIEALDRSPEIVGLARQACRDYPEIRVRPGDGLALPHGAGAAHVTLASLLLHHMEGDEPVRLLRGLYKAASRAVIVNDLRRGRLALAATWTGLRLLSGEPLIRHDGPLSVRRAFTPGEALALAREAGWARPRVSRYPLFRMALVAEKGAADAGA
jgi:SAM-dependent methyltransferase